MDDVGTPKASHTTTNDNPWRTPPANADATNGTARPGWLERTFGIKTRAGRLGCYGMLFAIAILYVVGMNYRTYMLEQESIEQAKAATAAQLAADKEAHERYEQSVADGSVCADGVDGSNIALVSAVKANLRDPDSFQHVKTVIGRINDKFQYPTLMEYRARNGFGGYNVSLVHARLRVSGTAGCTIDSALSLTR